VSTCIPVRISIHAPAQVEGNTSKEAADKRCEEGDRGVVPVVNARVMAYRKQAHNPQGV
jgi:hypothetical protein